jgi:hypothetical protein
LALRLSEGLGLAARMPELACEAKGHQDSCCEWHCGDAWLDDKLPSEGDATATWRRVLDVHTLDLSPQAGRYRHGECLCLLDSGIFRRPICVKDLYEYWEIVVINHFSVLGVPLFGKLGNTHPDSSWIGAQHSGD